ncbi:glutathione peroxidase [Parabacteroides sp. FAFU027]|uniref:glutathione peroxidase n=1 Tax=Parabacteroides sp. FAFU027 TaxID=2922715 RepID=UPI001FAF497B|nr:glutathione peroxidase [Parabacteroides sp. FAFU027]
MNKLLIIALVGVLNIISSTAKGFYSFKAKTIEGKNISMTKFRGHKILIVNVASKCGFTPEYSKLQALYLKYKDRNFVIVGFPANNFKEQEPGTNEEIRQFCTLNYQVSFPLMSKISVRGEDMHPIYHWLTEKKQNGVFDAPVKWNFQKFLIDEKGNLIGFMEPGKNPDYDKISRWIETGEWKQ